MIKPISLFSWLYDVEPDQSGIRFFLFRVWTVHHLDVDNIESVVETHPLLPGAWNAYNFKNRFLGRSFMLEKKRGWFTRRVLITPKDPDAFCAWVKLKNIDIRLPGETVR
ncbi:hypothetical protein [Undibacterium sp. YM2]|uniref:hypothetical protein n=1 Tax=Undibacterium sp. YM2 TaxID=2058625 RepID=UPI001389DF70|nr:hypothetical protein [Undibacterium sp. YM2]